MRTILAPWLKQRLAECADGVNLLDLANEAAQHFLADDAFIQETVADLIRAAAREEAQRIIRAKRGGAVLLGDVVSSRADIERCARSSKLWDWMEHVGERTIRLPDMTREDLQLAAKERQARGRRELTIAAFWNGLAEKLKPGQTIGQRFQPEEIEAITRKRETLEDPNAPKALREGTA